MTSRAVVNDNTRPTDNSITWHKHKQAASFHQLSVVWLYGWEKLPLSEEALQAAYVCDERGEFTVFHKEVN